MTMEGFSLLSADGLSQPQLDKVGRHPVSALCVTQPNDTVSDILAKLQLEWRRMPPVWSSGFHEPPPIEAHGAYRFFAFRIPGRALEVLKVRPPGAVSEANPRDRDHLKAAHLSPECSTPSRTPK